MHSIILYTASSLDGLIARSDGSIDWLFNNDDYGYNDFFSTVDVLLMGRKTFDQVLQFGKWPYTGKQSYIFTHRDLNFRHPDIRPVSATPMNFMKIIKNKPYKKIWLVGGARLTSAFLSENLVDEFIISIHPVLIGEGIPLFPPLLKETSLKLLNSKSYPDGLVQVHYRR